MTVSALQTQMSNADGLRLQLSNSSIATGVLSQYNYGMGIWVLATSGATVTSSTAAYNGEDGINFYDSPSTLIDGNIAHDNDQLAYDMWSAGIKGADDNRGSTNVTIENNLVYSNGVGQTGYLGVGIWIDTIGTGAVIRYNRVYSNNLSGIMLDADNGETVYGNVVYGNGSGIWHNRLGQGIVAFSDANTTLTNNQIYGNTVYGNYYGGIAINGPTPEQTNRCTNNTVSNNISTGDVSGVEFEATYGCENPGTNGSGNVYTVQCLWFPGNKLHPVGTERNESTYSAGRPPQVIAGPRVAPIPLDQSHLRQRRRRPVLADGRQ